MHDTVPVPDPVLPAPAVRRPYVGVGADGARESAQIDREEADSLAVTDPRLLELLTSADRWDRQADDAADADDAQRSPAATAGEQPTPSHTGPRTEAPAEAEDGAVADPVAQLRAWAARTGQGATLPVDRAAGFGPGAPAPPGPPGQTTPASPHTGDRGVAVPRQASSAGDRAVTWHRTADALTSLAQREADPQRAAATREHADVARRLSTAMGREHVARVTAHGGSSSQSGRQAGARSEATSHDPTSHDPTSDHTTGDQAGARPSSRLLERAAARASTATAATPELVDAGGFDAAAQPDADEAWRVQAAGHSTYAGALVEHDWTGGAGTPGWGDAEDRSSDSHAGGGGAGAVGW